MTTSASVPSQRFVDVTGRGAGPRRGWWDDRGFRGSVGFDRVAPHVGRGSDRAFAAPVVSRGTSGAPVIPPPAPGAGAAPRHINESLTRDARRRRSGAGRRAA